MKILKLVLQFLAEFTRNFYLLLRDAQTDFGELLIGMLVFSWGFFVMSPQWDDRTNTAAQVMREVCDQRIVWALYVFGAGAMRVVGVVMHYHRMRRLASLLCMTFWLFLTVVFWRNDFALRYRYAAPIVASFSLLTYLKLGRKADGTERRTDRSSRSRSRGGAREGIGLSRRAPV